MSCLDCPKKRRKKKRRARHNRASRDTTTSDESPSKISKEAAKRWRVTEGDRVVVEEFIPCCQCFVCRMGNYMLCDTSDPMLGASGTYFRYGGAIQLRIFECWREGKSNREAEEV